MQKTGTTTVGIVCKDAIVLAADTRTTAGYMIVNKEAKKVFKLTPDIAMTWAGSVSSNQMLIKYLSSELKLKKIKYGRDCTVKEAANLLRNWVYHKIRMPSIMEDVSHFLMAGKDSHGLHLYDIYADGSLMNIDKFISSGSGSTFVYGLLENKYVEGMSQKEGVDLALEAVSTAMKRDIASGNGINIFVITKNGVEEVMTKKVDSVPK